MLLESLAAAGNSHLYTSPNSIFIVMLVPWNKLWLECLYQANWQTMHIGAFFLENQLLNIYLCRFAPKTHAHTNTCSFSVFSVCRLNFLPLLRSQIDLLINRFAYHVFFSESLDTCLFYFSPGISISVNRDRASSRWVILQKAWKYTLLQNASFFFTCLFLHLYVEDKLIALRPGRSSSELCLLSNVHLLTHAASQGAEYSYL